MKGKGHLNEHSPVERVSGEGAWMSCLVLCWVLGAPRWSIGATVLRALVLTPEIPFTYLPLYSLPYHHFTIFMADKTPNDAAGFPSAAPGTVQSILREVRLARLVASMGGSYLLEGNVPFSPSSSPIVHYSNRRIVVVLDPSNADTGVHESIIGNRPTPPSGGRDNEEAKTFAASVITEPITDVTGGARGSGEDPSKKKGARVSQTLVVPPANWDPCLGDPDSFSSRLSFRGSGSVAESIQQDFNVAHMGVLLHFHTHLQASNMLYHGKPGKQAPVDGTKYGESPELDEGLKKLEEGFPETLALDIFCDQDVLIKVGLSKDIDNFPDIDLATLLRAKDGKPSSPTKWIIWRLYRGIDSSARCWPPRLLFSVAPTPIFVESSQPMGPEGRFSPFLPTPTPAD
ncbi:hypothetical protein LIER_31009 [Lithospermum erythrorhizon]|uniref:Uncharacterized protein n=1 Tax=Lithospermum erythrorhizon TaxID=34254 RepID=A0AAV3RUW3_LITER